MMFSVSPVIATLQHDHAVDGDPEWLWSTSGEERGITGEGAEHPKPAADIRHRLVEVSANRCCNVA
jgi:hypothetical protein